MNSLITMLGIESWKPIVSALLLPPVPSLVLILIGARLILPRRGWGWLVLLTGAVTLWLGATSGAGQLMQQFILKPPAALSIQAVADLKNAPKGKPTTAIVVLGGGVDALAPEYHVASLPYSSLERLRYGLWLSRETGIAVAFSGGLGWAEPTGQSEAQVASRIATQEFGHPIKWLEDRSRDTRENAAYTVALLKKEGIKNVVLVTHGSHMPRAVRAFEKAAEGALQIQPAPMGLAVRSLSHPLTWLPSKQGFTQVHNVLHELLGLMLGA
jgi:uncharacterized SAM-binding protein YcdF (DUF218 family)